jgi:hypothetical protein
MRNILMACVAIACVSPAVAADVNYCAAPAVASLVIAELNDLMPPAIKEAGITIVDAHDLVTVAAPNDGIFACHLVAEFSNGLRLAGTFSTKKNAAGDMLIVWKPGKMQQGSRT